MPQFLHTQLGGQYAEVKRIIESFNRNNLFTRLNSTSIANNINLLHMLDPTIIDEIDRNRKKFASDFISHQTASSNVSLLSLNARSSRPLLDFTQPQPTADALANLLQISMNLSQRDHNLPFSTNIERAMICNLPTNSDTYFHFGQISLEGQLKFLGLWNKNNNAERQPPPITAAGLAASISNFVSGATNTNQLTSTFCFVLFSTVD